jgi:hypothetical protein
MEQPARKWMFDYRVESDLRVDTKEEKLVYHHPDGLFEAHISNAPDGSPENEVLAVQIIFRAATLKEAEQFIPPHFDAFLYILSFATNTGYRLVRPVCLVDWTPGVLEREMYMYAKDTTRDVPDVLSSNILASVNTLKTFRATDSVRSALHWYAAAVRSRAGMEAQFHMFWLALELIAQSTKPLDKVSDKCQRCRSELYCPKCEQISQHRPFPRQAIETLLSKIGLSEILVEDLFHTRNGLMHGGSKDVIEASIQARDPNFQFDKGVDLIGRASWSAILNAFEKPDGNHNLSLLTVDTHVDWTVTGKFHIIMGMGGDPNYPKVEDLKLPTVEVIGADSSQRS